MGIAAMEAARDAGVDPAGRIEILATDIDTDALNAGRRAVYDRDSVARLPATLAARYLQPVSHGSPRVSPVPELRALVRFEPLDLLAEAWPECGRFDAVLCRNVLLYFSDAAKFHVLERFTNCLRPDALLFTSRVEGGLDPAPGYFEARGDSVFVLSDTARALAAEHPRDRP